MEAALVEDLPRALACGEIIPFFQPLVNLRTKQLSGYEVLARWRHKERGLLLPKDFITIAENTGLIGRLTEAVVCRACAIAARLPADISLSINISPVQFRDPLFSDQIHSIAESMGISPRRLTIELTESALLENFQSALIVAQRLKTFGMKLSLDDFGTGYSSLSNLQALPFDELKVDRSFIASMTNHRESRKIVAAVVGLGRSLGLKTVAEGVETATQAEMLLCLGCELGQGWLYGTPIPPEQISACTTGYSSSGSAGISSSKSDPMICLDALPAQRFAQLQAIYNGAPVGLCFLDCDLRYVSMNQRLSDMNGISIADHLGRRVSEVVPEVYEKAAEYLERAKLGESITGIEIQVAREQVKGSPTLLFSLEPAKDEAGEVVGISVAVVDITAREIAAEQLRVNRNLLQAVIDAIPLGIVIAEAPSGRIVSRNPQAEQILSKSLGFEAIGDYSTAIAYRKDGHLLDAEEYPLTRALLHGESTEPQIVSYFNGNDPEKWLSISGAPIRDDQGTIIGAVAVIQETNACVEVIH